VVVILPLSIASADGVAPDVDANGRVDIHDIGWTVIWFGSTDPPKSGGGIAASETYAVAGGAPVFVPDLGLWASVAFCDLGDAVTGGGYISTTIPGAPRVDSFPAIFNAPGEELDHGWAVTSTGTDFFAVGTCIDNAPLHEASLTVPGPAPQRVDELTDRLKQDVRR
jgi:hypothetical protein